MKKIILLIVFLLMASFASAIYMEGSAPSSEDGSAALLAADSKIMPPIPNPDGSIVGGNQYYSVNYDGEGEAAVLVKIEVQNIAQTNLTQLSLEIPGENLRIINIVQEHYAKESVCVEYEDVCSNYVNGVCHGYVRKCKRYYDQIVYPPKYYPIAYDKTSLSKSTLVTFQLPKEIPLQENAVILLYFKSESYAKKVLGAYKIDFETIKINADIQNVRVALNVDQDLVLEGKKAEVNYRDNFAMAEKSLAAPIAVGGQSDQLQQLSSFVTYTEGYVKSASGLDPLESFSVKGRYAKSWLGLHWIGSLLALLGLVAVGVGLYSLYVKKISRMAHGKIAAKTVGLGVASSVTILLMWFLTSFLVKMVAQSLDYQSASLFSVLIYLMSGLMMFLIFFGPAVYMGVKHGFMAGVWTIVATVVSMFIMMIIVLAFFLLFGQSPQYPGPIYRTFGGMAESAMM